MLEKDDTYRNILTKRFKTVVYSRQCMAKIKYIECEHVYLRPIEKEDAEILQKWRNDPQMRGLLVYRPPCTREDVVKWIEQMSAGDNVFLGIVSKEDDRLIGIVNVSKIDKMNRSAEGGIAIGEPEFRSAGIGFEVSAAVLDLIFDYMNLHRVYVTTHDYNEISVLLAKKFKFVEEGRQRDAILRGGKYHDIIVLSLLEDEWREVKKTL
jgi:RimJ/RimL family protein N-acetyltransferase